MSKEESLVPIIDTFIGSPDYEIQSEVRDYKIEVWLRSTISHYMKAYGEEVRRTVFQEVAKDHPEISHELHLLKESDRLKVT